MKNMQKRTVADAWAALDQLPPLAIEHAKLLQERIELIGKNQILERERNTLLQMLERKDAELQSRQKAWWLSIF